MGCGQFVAHQNLAATAPTLSDEYIELARTFHELSLKSGDSDEFDYRLLSFGKGLGWPELSAGYRTIVLSEAGAGKTEEIRHAALALRHEGKQAFFLRLEHIADDFEIAFEEGSLEEFEQWLVSDCEGWLFLDSVDEARLREPRDFERAVRKIGSRLSAALQRTHIVLTSRGSAWRPVTDLRLCDRHLRYVTPKPSGEENGVASDPRQDRSPFKIVALDDLSQKQAEIFAKARGLGNPKPFLDAIERADAWSMAARPDDLSELIDYWEKHERIGNRLELMQSSIARRLAERDQSRAEMVPLSALDAQLGARSVAAAATMTQESSIRVPDGSANTNGLAISTVLLGWDDKKCAALLGRPIFDEAIYETVRFHHRTVREYLTAEWFKTLLDRETSRRKIERLFFREQYGQEVIVPAMRPVLVWLILLDDKIRERALGLSPELIFEGGEPKALPPATRQAILRDVCTKMATGVIRSTTSDYRAVQRFADKDIAPDVKALLVEYASNDELQWFLQRMIWQGELIECLPEAKQVALNPKAGQYARIAAFRALSAIGGQDDNIAVRESFLHEAPSLDRKWFAELLAGAPPTGRSVTWVLTCVAKLKPKAPFEVDGVPNTLDAFVQSLELDLVRDLLAGLDGLIGRRPVVERRYCEISKRHVWLIAGAARAAERLVAARHPAALLAPSLSTLRKLPAAQQNGNSDLRDIRAEFPKLVPAWQNLNDDLFWFEVSQARRYREKKKRERLTSYRQVSVHGSYWQFTIDDFDRILVDLQSQPRRDDRLVALSIAFTLYVQARRPRKWRDVMKKAVSREKVLRDALAAHLHPAPQSDEQRRWTQQSAKWDRQTKRRDAADIEHNRRWKEHIEANVSKLRDPDLPNPADVSRAQYHLHERMRELDVSSSHWTEGHWQVLIPEFGSEISEAFRDGAVAYWRRYTPKLRSEGKADSQTPIGVIFGLTALNIESRETDGWASTLNEQEAKIAFRYAMDELNGFPDWMPALYEGFPDIVSRMLLVEVDRDLRIEKAKTDSNYALSDLSSSGIWAWEGIAGGIFDRLKLREPKNLTNLTRMLNIVNGSSLDQGELAKLAATRSTDRRLNHAARWFAVWTGIEPDAAIAALAARLKATKDFAKQTTLAMQFVTHLLGGRHSQSTSGDAFRTPKHLKTLYALMNQYVREREDIQRAGKGVYSPGLRDDAQDARNQLFSLLKEIPGKESYLALMDLALLHPEPSSRPWMEHHAKTKAELDADLTPWSVQQTLEFQTSIERTPANPRELFELAELRFLDLKDDLEHGDSSIAHILIKGATEETDMRKYIGDWLRGRANGRYSIPQEEELADAKRMDLRVHGVGFDAPVPCELKLADKWSGPKLFERLENQLCGDYLRDNRSSRGIFLLVYRGEKKHWDLPQAAGPVDFEGLVSALQDQWVALSANFPNVDEIAIVGIDLTRRNVR